MDPLLVRWLHHVAESRIATSITKMIWGSQARNKQILLMDCGFPVGLQRIALLKAAMAAEDAATPTPTI